MTEIVRARVEERLLKLRLGAVAERLDGLLSQAARAEPTYLDFRDKILTEETEAKQKKRVAMGIQIAHFPASLRGGYLKPESPPGGGISVLGAPGGAPY